MTTRSTVTIKRGVKTDGGRRSAGGRIGREGGSWSSFMKEEIRTHSAAAPSIMVCVVCAIYIQHSNAKVIDQVYENKKH